MQRLNRILILLSFTTAALGQSVPATINYQGRLTDNAPSPAAITATLNMQFEIWNLPSGGTAGVNRLWLEPASGSSSVAVTGGIFNVLLGASAGAASVPIPATVFTGGTVRYLQIIVNGETLAPRQTLSATGYANQAQGAEQAVNATTAATATNASQLGGVAPAGYQLATVQSCGAGQYLSAIANGSATCAPIAGTFIQNTTTQQSSANFNISGNGTLGGTLSTGPVTVAGVSSTTLTLGSGSGGIFGSNSAGNLHIDADKSKATGRLYLNYFNGNGIVFGSGAGGSAGSIDSAGNLSVNGNAAVGGNATVTGTLGTGPVTVTGAGAGTLVTLGAGTGGIYGSNLGGNLHIDANKLGSDGRIYLNYLNGNGVAFGNGANGVTDSVDNAGNWALGGNLNFGFAARQMLNLYGAPDVNGAAIYGIGVQSYTQYFRTDPGGGFAWFHGGTHNNAQNNPGAGGTTLMTLNSSGAIAPAGGVHQPGAGGETLRIIRGFVNSLGSGTVGSGYTSSYDNVNNNFVITFTTPFSGPPVVVVTPGYGTYPTHESVLSQDANRAVIFSTYNYSGTDRANDFNFIAIGPP